MQRVQAHARGDVGFIARGLAIPRRLTLSLATSGAAAKA
jgi:hypothetical protein